jgi:hypothetical protein
MAAQQLPIAPQTQEQDAAAFGHESHFDCVRWFVVGHRLWGGAGYRRFAVVAAPALAQVTSFEQMEDEGRWTGKDPGVVWAKAKSGVKRFLQHHAATTRLCHSGRGRVDRWSSRLRTEAPRVEGLQHLVPRQPLRPGAERFAEVYVGRERTIKQRRFGPIK